LKDEHKIGQDIDTILQKIPGFEKQIKLDTNDKQKILTLEQEAEKKVVLGAIQAENQGVTNALNRQITYAIAYRPILFSTFKDKLDKSSVIMIAGKEIVGEEISDPKKITELKTRKDVMLLGSSFVLYKDKIRKAKGEPKIVLPERIFPPLQQLANTKDNTSGSPSPPVDMFLKSKMNIDPDDPDIGTVIVGLNLKKKN
jgi:hypothetical protein|tara:strand:- start:147 stop:743 length:597 start_codon:yes stop_codon:yes gene_type:complete